MQKILVGLICTLALLAFLMPATIAEDSQNATVNITLNETQNVTANISINETSNDTLKSAPATIQMGSGKAASHTTVLRAGFEKTKPLNNLDVYGNKSTHNLSSSTSPSTAFNASQRLGNVSLFTYNTDNYKPLYNISQYSRTKPLYEVPNSLGSKPVYSISGYPEIKTANSIP
ncbi:MAG: hypothetical protein WAW52_08925 [Methanothrix sp.]